MAEIPRSPILGSSHQRTPRGDRQTYFPSAPPLTSSRPDTGLEDLGEGIAALGQSLGGLAIQGLKREKALEQAAIQSEARDLTQEFMSFYSDEIIEFDRAKNFDDATAEGWAAGVMEKFDAGIEDLFDGRSPEAIDLVALDIGRQRNKLQEKAFIHSAEQRALKHQSAFTDVVDTLAVSVAADVQNAPEALDALDETIEQFPEGQRDEIKRSVAERLYKTEGERRIRDDPFDAEKWLLQPEVASALDDPEGMLADAKKSQQKLLIEKAKAAQKREQIRINGEFTEVETGLDSLLDRIVDDNVTVSDDIRDQFNQRLIELSSLPDDKGRWPDLKKKFVRVAELDAYSKQVAEFSTKELNDEILALSGGRKGLTPEEYDDRAQKLDLLSNWTQKVEEDAYGALVDTDKVDHIPLDTSSKENLAATFRERIGAFNLGLTQLDRAIPVVTKEEVGELRDLWDQSNDIGRISFIEGIVSSGAPADQIAATFEALSPEGTDGNMLEYAAVKIMAGEKAAAETVLKGLDLLRRPGGAGRAKISGSEFENTKVSLYEAMGWNYLPNDFRNTVSRAVDAIYVVNRMNAEGEKEDKGDPTSVNTDVLDEAMAQVLGEIVKVNDYATAIPRGSTAKDVQGFTENLTLTEMRELSVVPNAAPVFIDADTGQEAVLDPQMTVDSSTFGFSIQGRERFHFVPWNFNGVYFVLYTDRDGNVSPLYVEGQGNREFLIDLGAGVNNYKAARLEDNLSNLESAVPASLVY